jgi:hypothetical protein
MATVRQLREGIGGEFAAKVAERIEGARFVP